MFGVNPDLLWTAFGCIVLAVVAAIGVTPTGRDWYDALGDSVGDLRTWLEGLL